MSIGIGKRELLEDYYPDELAAVLFAWAQLHGAKPEEKMPQQTDVMEFLTM